MRRSLSTSILFLAFGLVPTAAFAQMGGGPPTPLALDLKKVPVGSWAEYNMTIGQGMTMKSRVALVKRDASESVMEMGVEGGMAAMAGGKVIMKMVLAPDPTKAEKPIKQMIMQMGDRDPMEMPVGMGGAQQKFEKPDPKKMIGKETVKVTGGSFKTSHYRDATDKGTVDFWISEEVPPLGVVKMASTPKAGAVGPNGQPLPPVAMELSGHGKDAKPEVTKPSKPFNPAEMFGGPGGGPHGAGGPPPGALSPGGPPPGGPPAGGAPAPKAK
jgi:hypothetical protein